MEEVDVKLQNIVDFKILVHNTGDEDFNTFTIINDLPDSLEYVTASGDPFDPYIVDNILYWIFNTPL